MLNIIDISNWQRGLDLSGLFSANPELDGAVVKVTGGVSFRDNTAAGWVDWLQEHGKPFGFYHFLDDDFRAKGGKAEAQFFVDHAADWFGAGIPVADYEYPANNIGPGYLYDFLAEVYRLTGIRPMVYMSAGLIKWQDFSRIAAEGYPLWIAQYPDNNQVDGFKPDPWQSGSVSPWPRYWMQQYTSHGRLDGWQGNLDFNLFRGSYSEWLALAGVDKPADQPLREEDPEIVAAVLRNEYGTDAARTEKLRKAGYDPDSVQRRINDLYALADRLRPLIADELPYLDSLCHILRG